jgi:hypothetical protein
LRIRFFLFSSVVFSCFLLMPVPVCSPSATSERCDGQTAHPRVPLSQ